MNKTIKSEIFRDFVRLVKESNHQYYAIKSGLQNLNKHGIEINSKSYNGSDI